MLTYCNPLPMPASSPDGSRAADIRSLADPTVLKHDGKWYLYATGGAAWVSDDLLNWTYHEVELAGRVVAPTLEAHDGFFYLAGNGAHLYQSRHPLGPWEALGQIRDHQGNIVHWADLCFFRDDDGTFYCYHNPGTGVGTDGVFVTPLDPAKAQALAPSRHCFAYEPSHIWERFGDANEHADLAWIEAPWVIKRNGRYYLMYSGCGTEWRRYAVGVYTSESPVGPWTYDPRSPILQDRGGMLNGPGHHAMTIGPDGNWWIIYHVLFHQGHKFDRRLALDPVGFDADGGMFIGGPTEIPQHAPGARPDPAKGNNAGLSPLTINKPITASSAAPGRSPEYAVDNYIRTWWEAADATLPQTLEIDLLGEFDISASRIIFSPAGRPRGQTPSPYRYRIDVSADKQTWCPALDKASSSIARTIEYDTFAPTPGRYIRLTITGNASPAVAVGILQFTAFGRSSAAK